MAPLPVQSFLLAILSLIGCSVADDPTVTLSHGGQLRGLRTTFQNTTVDLFLGVRYAQPPTGQLRFKRPEPIQSWTGEVNTTEPGSNCLQSSYPGVPLAGSEDCLFLDITVPGGVEAESKKPVMVWIHGGGYTSGAGTSYVGAPLAVTGDVVIVTINYRLGILGFLIDGEGTGNFGLWDQRAALIWVKENIEQFGGDPDLVTIFGQSAGAASAGCQTIGQHNDGLFKRAITQAGSCFTALPRSENTKYKLAKAIRQRTNCKADVSIYDCFKHMTGEEVLAVPLFDVGVFMTPNEDGDFFAKDTLKDTNFQLAKRFDYMAGYNNLDGALLYNTLVAGYALRTLGRSVVNGTDMETTKSYLHSQCSSAQYTPFSAELCVDFLIRTYELDKAADDMDRAIKLTTYLGENAFGEYITHQLEKHSASDKSTYAYYFKEPAKLEDPRRDLSPAMKLLADHGDELGPIFGGPFLRDELDTNPLWKELVGRDARMNVALGANVTYTEEEKDFSLFMMRAWTNFARTGNPNSPKALTNSSPVWPPFNVQTHQFMEISEQQNKVVITPNKERIAKLRATMRPATLIQTLTDVAPQTCQ